MSDIRTVVLSIDEVKEVLGCLLDEKLAAILDEKLDEKLKIAKEANDNEVLRGAKQISRSMGFSETYFYKRFRDEMIASGYVYYVGHAMCSTTAKVREYLATLA